MALTTTQRTSASFPSSSSSFSSSLIPQWKYDVFLSFRGEDTRKNFTDHLYAALNRNGIYTFRDDLKLERGKAIRPELLKAIEESRFSIIVLSKSYASSTWCLDELVQIIECKNKLVQNIVPVFYDVDPSEVRNQTGHFKEAFAQHEKVFRENHEKVQKWRALMKEVGNLGGFHLKDGYESEFIQAIVKEISSKLSPTLTSTLKEFVGINLHLEKLIEFIGLGVDDVRLLGIYGMGGIGKTTIASVVYRQMSRHFEGSSFLANVREVSRAGNLVSLQEQLLSEILMESSLRIQNVHYGIDMIRSRLCHKKILIIIDDVDHIDQLKKLAGNRNWFGLGSRIIITTRDEHLLIAHEVDPRYKVECLDHDEALQLFSLKAFKNDHPPDNYIKLCKNVVKYVDGLPLALEVFGSFLFGRGIDEWKSALKRLKEDSGNEILDRLQIGFDGLEDTEKKIFLDVAIFFKGEDNDYVTKILHSCDFYPQIGIKILVEKCLLTVSSDNKLWMHDLLQDMAKKIVQKESPRELGRRSRLWKKEEVFPVLTKNLGTETVEIIIYKLSKQEKEALNAKAFSNMNKLRVLQIHNVQLPQGLDYLSNELRFLEWHGYPLKSLPSSFQPDNIVALNLSHSSIEQLWKGIKLLKLKFINLSHCQNLTKMPDFTKVPNLESIILEGCTRLSEVHQSIGVLKRLILLNLKDCKSLSSLPSIIEWESLEVCILAGCSKLSNFSEIIGKMKFLKKLDLSGMAIGQFPSSTFLSMKILEVLSFRGCKGPSYKSWNLLSPIRLMQRRGLDPMPLMLPSLSGLCSLTNLDLSDCNLLEGAIPNDFGCISSMRDLILDNNNFVTLPASISRLSNLKFLSVKNCKRLHLLELPLGDVAVSAEACSSLKTLSNPFGGYFNGFGCFQLMENNMAFARMKRYLQELSNQSSPIKSHKFNMVIPGGEIPEWFTHQSKGSSISIERVPLLHNSKNTKLMGFAVCSIFVVHDHTPVLVQIRNSLLNSTHVLCCQPKVNDSLTCPRAVFYFTELLGQAVSDHLWLLYFRHDAKWQDFSDIGFSFILHQGKDLEVKKCGVRAVYKHDVEEFNQTTMNGAVIKRIHDECDRAEEASGSDSFVEEAQPKRLKTTPKFV